jgi:uncharacterized metal-binding protein YceD (DUF177 family)
MTGPWPLTVPLADIDRAPVHLHPAVDAATCARIAKTVGVDALNRIDVELTLKPWLDGAELHGRLSANVTQTCGITLDPFDSNLRSDFTIRVVPAGSNNAPTAELHEVEVDPEADDPPDVLEGEVIDVGAYVVEHLALEVDPFPRKPGAVFEQPGGVEVISPFASLAALKDRDSTK